MGHEQEGTQLSGTASGAIFQCLCPKLHSWGVKSPHCLFQAHCSTGGAGLQQVAGRGQPKVRAIAVSEGIFFLPVTYQAAKLQHLNLVETPPKVLLIKSCGGQFYSSN